MINMIKTKSDLIIIYITPPEVLSILFTIFMYVQNTFGGVMIIPIYFLLLNAFQGKLA